ncbi:hypothetical protein FKP32DRAFT_1679216 [Trametes sanguinea]|nr:hypothetical protein FKP32DRAFT_1679216 [Trametes sanguinea]
MDRLPEELIAYIFDHLEAAHALSPAMLVNRRWYMYGARNLHAALVFTFGFDMTVDSSHVVISFMRRLVSPTLATAQLVRHLAVFGIANREVQGLLRDVLRQATTLRSLDVHALQVLDDETLLRSDLVSMPDLLPNLSALNIASTPSLHALLNTRRMRALRVHEPMGHEPLTRIVDRSGAFATCICSLELAIIIDRPMAAVEEMEYLSSALAHAPLRALALQFVLDRPGLMSWSDYEELIAQMGPVLQTLPSLGILSLVIRPDPMMPLLDSNGSGSGESQRELRTRTLAERLIADNGLSQLTRIELRWHGWEIRSGQLEAVPRPSLLRLPQSWIYEQCRGELG